MLYFKQIENTKRLQEQQNSKSMLLLDQIERKLDKARDRSRLNF